MVDVGNMQDQGMVRGAPFHGVDARHGHGIGGIGGEAVDGFGGEGHQAAALQRRHGGGDGRVGHTSSIRGNRGSAVPPSHFPFPITSCPLALSVGPQAQALITNGIWLCDGSTPPAGGIPTAGWRSPGASPMLERHLNGETDEGPVVAPIV